MSKIGVFSCGPNPLTNSVNTAVENVNIGRKLPYFIHHYENFGWPPRRVCVVFYSSLCGQFCCLPSFYFCVDSFIVYQVIIFVWTILLFTKFLFLCRQSYCLQSSYFFLTVLLSRKFLCSYFFRQFYCLKSLYFLQLSVHASWTGKMYMSCPRGRCLLA